MGKTDKIRQFGEKYGTWVILFLLAVMELYFFWFLNKYMNLLIGSDESSELLLGKILSQGNGIYSTNWYYSSEFRILHSTLIYSLVFRFIQNWRMVRLVSVVIIHVILLASLWFLTRQIRISKLFPLIALLVLTPISDDYYYIVLWAGHYTPSVILSFLGLGFMAGYTADSGKGKNLLYLILSLVIAFLTCAVGLRQMLSVYLPAALTAMFFYLLLYTGRPALKKVTALRLCTITFLDLLAGGLGYLFNQIVLTKYFSFMGWGFKFTGFNLDRFIETINGFLNSFGFRIGEVTAKSLISNVVAGIVFLLAVFAIVYALKNSAWVSRTYYSMTVFFLFGLMLFLLLYGFSDMSYFDRYNLTLLVFVWFLIALWIHEAHWFSNRTVFAVTPLLLMMIGAGMLEYRYQRNACLLDYEAEDRTPLAAFLKEQGYTYGYSGFWEANVLTELADGDIEMQIWFFGHNKMNEHVITDVEPWGQVISHNGYIPEGKVFALFSGKDYHYYQNKQLLPEDHLIYETENHRVYSFRNYEEMKSYLVK
ncbi:MAG: hypothetical protein IKD66_11760 [Solobacterium sp.]|nr:hypothetical protein [Solobacterium sp.]